MSKGPRWGFQLLGDATKSLLNGEVVAYLLGPPLDNIQRPRGGFNFPATEGQVLNHAVVKICEPISERQQEVALKTWLERSLKFLVGLSNGCWASIFVEKFLQSFCWAYLHISVHIQQKRMFKRTRRKFVQSPLSLYILDNNFRPEILRVILLKLLAPMTQKMTIYTQLIRICNQNVEC